MTTGPREETAYFTEDITIGSAATYTTGGQVLTVAEGRFVEKMISVTPLYAAYIAQPVQNSETGQSFKMAIFNQTTGTGGGAFTELANASSAATGGKFRVFYRGS